MGFQVLKKQALSNKSGYLAPQFILMATLFLILVYATNVLMATLLSAGVVLGVIALSRFINKVPVLSRIIQPFYKKACQNCDNPFSLLDDLFRKHTVTGIRFTTCKKCECINYVAYDGKLFVQNSDDTVRRVKVN